MQQSHTSQCDGHTHVDSRQHAPHPLISIAPVSMAMHDCGCDNLASCMAIMGLSFDHMAKPKKGGHWALMALSWHAAWPINEAPSQLDRVSWEFGNWLMSLTLFCWLCHGWPHEGSKFPKCLHMGHVSWAFGHWLVTVPFFWLCHGWLKQIAI